MGLAHANRVTTMGPLTASITHEVKQPITAMVANAHRRRKGDLNEKPAGMNRRGLVSVSAN